MKIFELVTLFNALYIESLNYKISVDDIKRFKKLYIETFPGEQTTKIRESFLPILAKLDKSIYAANCISDRTFHFESVRSEFIELINGLN